MTATKKRADRWKAKHSKCRVGATLVWAASSTSVAGAKAAAVRDLANPTNCPARRTRVATTRRLCPCLGSEFWTLIPEFRIVYLPAGGSWNPFLFT